MFLFKNFKRNCYLFNGVLIFYLGVSQREPKVKIAFCFLRSVTNRRLGLKTHASLKCVPPCDRPCLLHCIPVRVLSFQQKMASRTPNNSLKRPATSSIIGYVHHLSPEKRNKKNTMDYASFTLQTLATDTKEALIYSKHKRQLFSQSQTNRTPIKLTDFTFTENREKIVVNDMTFVSVPQPSEYAFQYSEIKTAEEEPSSVLEVLNSKNEWDKEAVRGKIANLTEPTKVSKNQLNLAIATIVDQTATMPIDLWENHIHSVIEGHSYEITSVQVRTWAKRKKLSTTVKTQIKEIKDEEIDKIEISQTRKQAKDTVVIKEFSTITKCEKFQKCPKFQKKIPQTTCARIAKCHKCGMMKADKCQVGLFLTVTVETTEKELSLHMSDEILASILKHVVSSMDKSAIGEELLFVENISVTYDVDSLVISNVEHA